MTLARYAVLGAFAALAAGCAISTQQEFNIGRQYADQLARELPLIKDPRIQDDLDGVAARLKAAVQRLPPPADRRQPTRQQR